MRPAPAALLLSLAILVPAMAAGQTPVTSEGGRVVVQLARLGDADGDGRADLLRIDTLLPDDEDAAVEVTARAVSGADLGQVLWTVRAPEGAGLAAWQDVDGDGVLEVLQSRLGFSGSSDALDLFAAGTSSFHFALPQDVTVLGGTDGQPVASFRTDSASDSMEAYAVALGANDDWSNSTIFAASGGGAVLESFLSRHTVWAGGPVGLSRVDSDTRLRVHGAGGVTELLLDADDRFASHAALAQLDGRPGLDFVVLDALVVQPLDVGYFGVDTYEPELIAYDTALKELWRQTFPRVQGDVGTPVAIGDLDGDGRDDVAFYVRHAGLSGGLPEASAAYQVRFLSGADGREMGDISLANLHSPRPLGDMDGDGKEEILVQHFTNDVPEAYVAGLDLAQRWSLAIDESVLLNPDGPGRRMTDLSGDGRPDLAHAREFDGGTSFRTSCNGTGCTTESSFSPYQMKLDVLGADGKPHWSRELSDLLTYADVRDLDGRGGADVAVVRIDAPGDVEDGDLRDATLTLEVYAGEDGEVLLQHVLRSPQRPVARDGLPRVSLVEVGDLDGRPGAELAVGVREVSADDEAAADEDVVQEWTVFSLAAGRPIARLDAPRASDGAAEDAQPGVAADTGGLDAAPDIVPVGDPQDAPLPVAVALAAVAAAALARRRRA